MGGGDAGWAQAVEATANFSRSKFGKHLAAASAAAAKRPSVSVSFSPFQIPYVVNTGVDDGYPLVQIVEPPWSSNQTAGFASLLPLRKLGRVIVPITLGGRTASYSCCDPDTNSTCLADLTHFLTSPARRAAAVAELVAIAKNHSFSGWNFDQEWHGGPSTKRASRALTAGWRSFLQELAAAMTAADPESTVSVDICGCGGDIPLENVSTVADYMGMLPQDWGGIGVEAVSMCTYTNDSAKPYIQKGQGYDVFDERLACIHNSYGPTVARVGLGQEVPSMNPSVEELKRQLRHVEAMNLTKLAVFQVPSLYSSVEWLDVIYDWIAARAGAAIGTSVSASGRLPSKETRAFELN